MKKLMAIMLVALLVCTFSATALARHAGGHGGHGGNQAAHHGHRAVDFDE